MKRLPQTLTAAALTGALAFGGAAVAQAQIPAPVEDKPLTEMPTPSADEETTTATTPAEEDTSAIPAPATKMDAEGNLGTRA